jgi:hypothetical protein
MVKVTPKSTPEQRQASRAKYAAYWELRDAMVLLWNATETQKAPFYLYACNLAKIAGFQQLFTGFNRPVFGSTDVTGPPPRNWEVEWESGGRRRRVVTWCVWEVCVGGWGGRWGGRRDKPPPPLPPVSIPAPPPPPPATTRYSTTVGGTPVQSLFLIA